MSESATKDKPHLKVKAYAKINLILKVISKRKDGYHNILSLMQNIDLADNLAFSLHNEIKIESNLQIKPQDNLVFKAAKSLQAYAKTNEGAIIYLDKKIPIEAGLGGGSSDAAATLVALNKLWKINLSNESLKNIAATIGADVSFFIDGGTALVEGIGEKVQKLEPIENFGLVVAKPPFGISAKDAYEKLNFSQTLEDVKISEYKKIITEKSLKINDYCNDLEQLVLDKHNKIRDYYDAGYKNKAKLIMLSGSGSAFFALAKDDSLSKIAQSWQEVGLETYKVKTINRSMDFES